MKNSATVQIQLTFVGGVVAEIRSDALTEPLLIGRDPSAAWRAPAGDRTMAARAAVLERRDGWSVLRAEPDQSFRVNGAVTSLRVLRVGDRIALGDCEILVTAALERQTYAAHHRLEPLVGEHRGVFVDLTGESFSVGSDETADLRLVDDTVSHRHATLSLRGDECWVRDGSSRNGTFVNGQRLGGKERLLHDGDILGFGPFEYRFLDRAVPHVRATAAKNVLVAFATLLVVGGGWWAYYRTEPDAPRYMLAAAQFAYAERFDEAEKMLEEAAHARRAAENEELIANRRERVATWRTTARVWESFRDNLEQRRFAAARGQIGQLSLDNSACWSWNEDRRDERLASAKEAVELLQLARAFWVARNDSDQSLEELAALAAERRERGVDKPDFTQDDRPWMRSVRQLLVSSVASYDENVARYVALTNEVNRLAGGQVGAKAVLAKAEEVAHKADGVVRAAANMMIAPLLKLEEDRALLEADTRALARFDRKGYSGRPLVTTPDDCTISPSLQLCQRQHVEWRRALDLASLEILAARRRLESFGIAEDRDPDSLVVFEDTNRVDRAFLCELLNARHPPQLGRTQPVDDTYDRLFGYEFLYSFIEEGYFEYPHEVDVGKLVIAGFQPEICTLALLAEELRKDLKALEGKEFDFLRKWGFETKIDRLRGVLRRIEAVRDRFDAIAGDPAENLTRRGILARAAVLLLTTHDEVTKEVWEDLRRREIWQRENVLKKASEIDPTHPEKARETAKWILSRSVPGSPSARKAWNYR